MDEQSTLLLYRFVAALIFYLISTLISFIILIYTYVESFLPKTQFKSEFKTWGLMKTKKATIQDTRIVESSECYGQIINPAMYKVQTVEDRRGIHTPQEWLAARIEDGMAQRRWWGVTTSYHGEGRLRGNPLWPLHPTYNTSSPWVKKR